MSHCNELYSITAQAENGVNQFDRMDFDASSKSKNGAIFDIILSNLKAEVVSENSDQVQGDIEDDYSANSDDENYRYMSAAEQKQLAQRAYIMGIDSLKKCIFDKKDIKALIAELREMSDEMRGFIVK